MSWKVPTTYIGKEIYFSLLFRRTKGCCKGTSGTDDLLHIDQHLLNKVKTKWENVDTGWINFTKVYNMVTITWIIEGLKMNKISDHVFTRKAMENLNVEIVAAEKPNQRKIQETFFRGAIRIYSLDIGMEFECSMRIMKIKKKTKQQKG